MYKVLEQNVYKLPDGKIWKGSPADLPTAQADLIAKAGKEYPTEWLKEQGALEVKKAPAKKEALKRKKLLLKKHKNQLRINPSK